MSQFQIPKGWEVFKLKDLTNGIGDGIHSTPNYVPNSEFHFINGNNLRNGSIIITDKTKMVDEAEYQKYKLELTDKTVLLSINGTIGNVAFYTNEKVILGKSACYINCNNKLDVNFLFYLLQSNLIKNYFRKEQTKTSIYNLSLYSVRNTPITRPSIPEQKKIVQKLDHVLGQLEKKKKQILELNQRIDYNKIIDFSKKQFLKLSFTSSLTEEWRKNHSKIKSAHILLEEIVKKRKKSYAIHLEDLKSKGLRKLKSKFLLEIPALIPKNNELPKSWITINVDFLAFVTKLAGFEYSKYMRPENYIEQQTNGEVPLIRAQNVHMGKFENSNIKFISKETSDKLERSQINGNEILMVSIGAGTGNVCLAPTDQKWHLAPNVAKIEVDMIDREYLYYFLQSPIGILDTLSRMTENAQPSLSTRNIRMINVNLAPLEEQKEIVKLIKQKLPLIESFKERIDELIKKQEESVKNLNYIQSSILDSAFSGKLVN